MTGVDPYWPDRALLPEAYLCDQVRDNWNTFGAVSLREVTEIFCPSCKYRLFKETGGDCYKLKRTEVEYMK